ncbi:hypothetical protein CROQUDRAFT_42511 [Cronartium quercuum f. sp. fusiforme G11]|uniref:Probable methionine--tRNA ligase, mitochondrial n=1 Tax=Cronartium quercuum f. sp. fusiforme G11 TaxID=708437 RepID=A0A9P6NQD3_9BASI|nr:hypothetical protein CROQUDRAFT_42511 [Cronartium quercuum f. sp. fusiforme G11]
MLIADVLARFNALRHSRPSFLSTGTDEHGLKIERAAGKLRKKPSELCETVSVRFRELARVAKISNTDFVRTTEPRHHLAAQTFWRRLWDKGQIYKGKYQGWYSVSDEAYYAAGQVQKHPEKEGEMVSIETGQTVEWIEEENYMFRLSDYRDRLAKWCESALVSSQKRDIIHQLGSKELPDLSISRPTSRLSWGVPVPEDPEQVMYVWIDALTNYLTVTGYPWSVGPSTKWPPDVHVVGKDITKFHAIYWPAMLMAAGLKLPRHVIAHGHWTMKAEKMSKSRGNVADPFEAMSEWGVDGLRYYLMRAPGSLWNDTDWAPERVTEHYRKELAGQLGNLLSRISAPRLWSRFPPGLRSGTGLFYPPSNEELVSERRCVMSDRIEQLPDEVERLMGAFEIPKALKSIFDVLTDANRLISDIAPWHSSTPPSAAHEAVYLCAESLRFTGILLQAFIPTKAAELLDMLGVPQDQRGWDQLRLGCASGFEVRAGDGATLFPGRTGK